MPPFPRERTWGTDTKGYGPWTRTQASGPESYNPWLPWLIRPPLPSLLGKSQAAPPPPPGAKRYPKSPGALVSLCSCPAGKGCPGMFSEPSAFVPQSLGQYLRIPGVPLVTKSLPSSRQTVLRAEMSHCSLLFREEPSPFGSVSGWSSPGHQASLGLGGCALPLQRWGD